MKSFDIEFFYGSNKNEFWKLFILAKQLDYKFPYDFNPLKSWLNHNHWIVSDIVLETKRKNETALDKDLGNIKWNIKIIQSIFEKNQIEKIYFTSKWVLDKFNIYFQELIPQKYETIQLISPSNNGLRNLRWANTQLPRLKNETSKDYRIRFYELALK
ncbi:MAG: hypothetical protein IIC74_08575 [Bacteroidetes bacterium]|nr:hypothetical protein [Bacteroidota bacterium]